MNLKYNIIGAGGTGGNIGGFLTHGGKDVTFVVRGNTKKVLDRQGLHMISGRMGEMAFAVKTASEDEVAPADVVFVCVKGYSLTDILPLIEKSCHENTLIIPVLNIFGTGSKLQKHFPNNVVTDGCVYIAGFAEKPGYIHQQGKLFRVVFGTRDGKNEHPYLQQVASDLQESHVDALLSYSILKDTYQKFAFVSPMAVAGLYFDATAEQMAQEGEIHNTFVSLVREAITLGKAMNIAIEDNEEEKILVMLTQMAPDTTTSLQKDMKKGGQTEMDGLLFEVVRLAKQYHVSLPYYEKIAKAFCE